MNRGLAYRRLIAAPEAPAGAAAVGKNTGFQGESLTLLAVGKVSKLGLGEGLLILVPVAFYDLSFFTV